MAEGSPRAHVQVLALIEKAKTATNLSLFVNVDAKNIGRCGIGLAMVLLVELTLLQGC